MYRSTTVDHQPAPFEYVEATPASAIAIAPPARIDWPAIWGPNMGEMVSFPRSTADISRQLLPKLLG